MVALSFLLIVSSLSIFFLPPIVTAQHEDSGKTERQLDRTLDALEKGLDFMERNHQNINLDGVIGPRLVEGQLDVLLGRIEQGELTVQTDTRTRLARLQYKAGHLSDGAIPYVNASQPAYYARIGAIIQKNFWIQDHSSRDLNMDLLRTPIVVGEAMDEQDSDNCLTELFGTNGKNAAPCRVSRYCWKLMSAPGYRGYSLSHQLFYMLIAESVGCLTHGVESAVTSFNDGFCANMMVQAKTIAQQHFPPRNQDLFMEIQALCGVAGYREFFRDDWLEKIIGWQMKPHGCWGLAITHDTKYRVRREERVLSWGCKSHQTAVALGSLVENVRYIIEYMQEDEGTSAAFH